MSGAPSQRMPTQRQPSPALPDASLYRLLIENLPQSAVYLYDHDLRYLLAEGEAIRAAGLDDMVGQRLSDVASGESLAILEAHYRAALAGEEIDVEHPGEDLQRWYRVRIRPVRDAGGEVVAGLVVTDDVTEARFAREELRTAHSFQETIFATSPDIVTIFDLDAEQTLWASRSFDEMFGRSLDETRSMQATGMGSLLHPDDLVVFADDMARVAEAADGEILEGSARVLCADGSWRILARRSTPFMRTEDGRVCQVLNVSWDMTQQTAASTELDNVRAFQDAIIATTPDLILLMDRRDGSIAWTSRPVGELLGWSLEELDALGEDPFQRIVHPDDLADFDEGRQRLVAAADGDVVHQRWRVQHSDGHWVWLSQRATVFARDDDGVVTQVLLQLRDVSEGVRAEQELKEMALHDHLTGLANRRLVTDRLRMAVAHRESDGEVGALFLDLDDFKPINDELGHAVGDLVLREVAERIVATVRAEDTVGRVGGDEFVVLLAPRKGQVPVLLAAEVADRVREAVAAPMHLGGRVLTVRVSIGIAIAGPGDDVDSVLSRADHGMYEDKSRSRD